MRHLSLEALCRIVDEAPTQDELAHLEACGACGEELEALRSQTEALAGLPDLRPPVGDWEVLQARLISDGLVRRPAWPANALAMTPAWMRVAAALLLFVGGTAVGAAVARPGPAGTGGASDGVAFAATVPVARSADEAAELVRVAERRYMDALLQYRQLAEEEGRGEVVGDPATRFAALDYLVAAGQAAVRQAPADPFLNGLLASALAERQSVLRRISSGPDQWF